MRTHQCLICGLIALLSLNGVLSLRGVTRSTIVNPMDFIINEEYNATAPIDVAKVGAPVNSGLECPVCRFDKKFDSKRPLATQKCYSADQPEYANYYGESCSCVEGLDYWLTEYTGDNAYDCEWLRGHWEDSCCVSVVKKVEAAAEVTGSFEVKLDPPKSTTFVQDSCAASLRAETGVANVTCKATPLNLLIEEGEQAIENASSQGDVHSSFNVGYSITAQPGEGNAVSSDIGSMGQGIMTKEFKKEGVTADVSDMVVEEPVEVNITVDVVKANETTKRRRDDSDSDSETTKRPRRQRDDSDSDSDEETETDTGGTPAPATPFPDGTHDSNPRSPEDGRVRHHGDSPWGSCTICPNGTLVGQAHAGEFRGRIYDCDYAQFWANNHLNADERTTCPMLQERFPHCCLPKTAFISPGVPAQPAV